MLHETQNSTLGPKQLTTQPYAVGSSVIGIKYKDGVLIASDKRINVYGHRKYNNVTRIAPINKYTIMGSSGEYSDFQELNRLLVEKAQEDELYDGVNSFLGPEEFSSYLSHINYQQRNKMNPYWSSTIIGGWDKRTNEPFLNSVDQFGTKLENSFLFTGFAQYFAGPIFESMYPKFWDEIDRAGAKKIADQVFKVLFYRDASAGDRIYYGYLQKGEGEDNFSFELLEDKLETNWEYKKFVEHHNEKFHPTA
mmetsp:Transcript_30943/g.32132  ORF Transcript_30943/g.32132 Transcript_30943/m.32132 type:complete len:251 (+) Transcript_30943:54-806(+)